MTSEIKDVVALRISKFTSKNKIYFARIVGLLSICLLSLFCGYMLHFLFLFEKESIYSIVSSHFGAFYREKNFIKCVFATARYALGDMLLISAFAFFGYTMLSSILSRITLALYSVLVGFCGAFVFDLLIRENLLSGGSGAFTLFAVSKIVILTVCVFCTLQIEDFSYRFSDIFRSERHPLLHRDSKAFLVTMISNAGFTAIINTIYLIFMSIQKCSLL